MWNPARVLAKQFVHRSPTTLLVLGITLSLIDFVAVYAAAVRDGVLHISEGTGLLNHYGLLATIMGNAISLYAAKKYLDGVCSIRISRAVTDREVIEGSLRNLKAMIELQGKYQFVLYLFLVFGALCWVSNLAIHTVGNPLAKWGLVFDSLDHPWSFFVGRLHLLFSWIIIMPFVVYVMVFSSLQLRKAMAVASNAGVLTYDLLNPDQRGGFGFVDNALLAFNAVAALFYVEITMHIETFAKLNLEHIINYIILTTLLIGINRMFFADLYATIKRFKVEALNKVKEKVFKNDELSFEVLKYCYERRIRMSSIANFVIQAGAIAVPGVVKLWPFIVKVLTRA
jgi:riboflavin transporter FmnP